METSNPSRPPPLKLPGISIRTRILLLGMLAIACLCYILGVQVLAEYRNLAAKQELLVRTQQAENLSELVHELQKERGLSAGYLASRPGGDAGLLNAQRLATDRKVAQMDRRLLALDPDKLTQLPAVRDKISRSRTTQNESFDYYTDTIIAALDRISVLARESDSPLLKSDLFVHSHLMRAKEQLGEIRAGMMEACAAGSFGSMEVVALGKRLGLFEEHYRMFLREANPVLAAALRSALADPAMQATQDIVRAAIADRERGLAGITAEKWFATATTAIDLLNGIEKDSFARLRERVGTEMAAARDRMLVHAAMTILASLMLAVLAISAIRRLLWALDRLLSSVQHIIRTRNFAERIPLNSGDEMSKIARGFNELLAIAERLIQEKDFLAAFDPLTATCNRRRFAELFANEMQREQRYRRGLALVMLDIDHFKEINDSHGHAAGDSVLVELAQLIGRNIRPSDTLGRWGGEEFILLIPETGLQAAAQAAGNLRGAIDTHRFAAVPHVTASFGVTACAPDDTLESASARADRALYRAKREGRNRVCTEHT